MIMIHMWSLAHPYPQIAVDLLPALPMRPSGLQIPKMYSSQT